MAEDQKTRQRSRGRPQVRRDDETRHAIVGVARSHFLRQGYASANVNDIAPDAGVSTKTLYRLFPTKSDLFTSVVGDSIDQFIGSIDDGAWSNLGIRDGLVRLLTAYGRLTLAEENITLTRLVIGEADRFPEIAAAFFDRAIRPTSRLLEDWLRKQVAAGKLTVGNPGEASGMLRGMMVMDPQRATMLGQAPTLTDSQISQRAVACADLFLSVAAALNSEGN